MLRLIEDGTWLNPDKVIRIDVTVDSNRTKKYFAEIEYETSNPEPSTWVVECNSFEEYKELCLALNCDPGDVASCVE